MATSGSFSFTLPFDELLEQATLRVGGEPTGGTEARTARRALNLLFTDITNRGYPLHQIELVQTALVSAVATVTCSLECYDVLDVVVRTSTSGADIPLERLGFGEYLQISSKTQQGRPSQFYIHRRRDVPVFYLWPSPDRSDYVLHYWRARQPEDVTKLAEDPDYPRRFFPALVAGLAYYLAMGRGMAFPMDRLAMLKADYEEQLRNAMEEDRERATFKVRPRYRRR